MAVDFEVHHDFIYQLNHTDCHPISHRALAVPGAPIQDGCFSGGDCYFWVEIRFPWNCALAGYLPVLAASVPGWAEAASALARISNCGDLYLANYKARFPRIKASDYRSKVEN